MKRIYSIVALFSLTAGAQTWHQIARENDTVNSLAAGSVIRYGAPSCSSVVPPAASWFYPPSSPATPFTANNGTFGGDPAPNCPKELDIQETSAAQVVTVNGQPVTVPALSGTATLSSGTHTITLSAVNPPTGMSISADSIFFGASHLPTNGSSRSSGSVWFTITIDGVALNCTYNGQAYAPNNFPFACTVAPS